ncbi:TraM recognition domain-containing protein [Persephonella sp.]
MQEIRYRKGKLKRVLLPQEWKQRKELSYLAFLVASVLPFVYPNSYFWSLFFATAAFVYGKYASKKLEESRIGGDDDEVVFTLGKDEFGRPIEITRYYFHRHIMVVGGTGMGKTSMYRLLLRDAIQRNFGIIYINFKAEDEDFFNLYSICEEFGLENDLLLLNLAPSSAYTGETATYAPQATLKTPQEIYDFYTNLLPPATGEMEYWQGRGKVMMAAAAHTFVYMRDIENKPPDLKLLVDSFEVPNMVKALQSPDCPQEWKEWINLYLQDLDPTGKLREGNLRAFTPEMQNQHGYALQQWKEAMMDIIYRYGHIFNTPTPDIDFKEAVKNSRLIYIHMPALALPAKTKEYLGRLILAGLKTAVSAMLGERLLGSYKELKKLKKKEKPKNPFLILIDEHGTAPITGLDDFQRQIRSLGGGSVIADQNWDSIKEKFGEAYLNTLLGNSMTKIIMNVEGSQAVLQYLESRIPKIKTLIPEFQYNEDSLIEHADRITLQEEPLVKSEDVMKLGTGEAYIIQKEKVVKSYFDLYKPPEPDYIDLFVVNREKIKYSEEIREKVKNLDKYLNTSVEIVEIKQLPPLEEKTEEKTDEQTDGGEDGLTGTDGLVLQYQLLIEDVIERSGDRYDALDEILSIFYDAMNVIPDDNELSPLVKPIISFLRKEKLLTDKDIQQAQKEHGSLLGFLKALASIKRAKWEIENDKDKKAGN